MRFIRSFDFFMRNKYGADFSSRISSVFTVSTFVVATLLIIIEIAPFQDAEWVSEMSSNFKMSFGEEVINIDITFHKAPCILLSLTHNQYLGLLDRNNSLTKERFNVLGESLGLYVEQEDSSMEGSDVAKAIDSREYCRIYGNASVSKMLGGVFIQSLRSRLKHPECNRNFGFISSSSMDFTLNHLSFGSHTVNTLLQAKLGSDNLFAPYDGFNITVDNLLAPDDRSNITTKSQFENVMMIHIRAVPSYYYSGGDLIAPAAYQYSLRFQRAIDENSRSFYVDHPGLWITYEFSPIAIHYHEVQYSYYNVLTIIGAVSFITGLVKSLVMSLLSRYGGPS